jgi:uncharacterized membrane protein
VAPLTIVLGMAMIAWPAVLGAALVDRLDHDPSLASSVVYVAAARVCHQRADRSFHTRGQQWPVCARCAGLYLAAPFGVVMAAASRRRRRAGLARVMIAAAVPLAATWMAEAVVGLPVPALMRLVMAVPLGVAVAYALVMLARTGRSNQVD